MAVNGTAEKQTFSLGLLASSPGCHSSVQGTECLLSIAILPGFYTGTFTTYDGPLVTGAPTGHILSANQSVSLSIASGVANMLTVSLDGVPARVSATPGTGSAITGNATTGLGLSKCATIQPMNVTGVDADGNSIVGPGAPAITVASGDSTHLAVGLPTLSAPNTFSLSVPALPNAKYVVHLSLTATPHAGSGAIAVQTQTTVTFNSDICGKFTEFPIPSANGNPYEIASGPDGALWFSEQFNNKIGRITTAGTVTNEYAGLTTGAKPAQIVAGPDGAMWFAESGTSSIGRMAMNGAVLEYPTKTMNAGLQFITKGPDNNLWFNESTVNQIGQITTSGNVNEYSVPTSNSYPAGIVTGPDNYLWFVENSGHKVGRMSTTGSVTNEIAVAGAGSPQGIATGADHNLWFVEATGATIDQIVPSISPVVTRFGLPDPAGTPIFITAGPDNAVWTAELGGNAIVRMSVDASHTITRYLVPTVSSAPYGITTGPDGAIWFAELGADKIGRLQ
jgi:virginiamycin B lyase